MKKSTAGPLDGITVLDFTWVLAGPFATRQLRDLGAEILKVEIYKKGATERSFVYRVTNEGVEQSSYSINVNRGKKSLCINMKNPKGMELIHGLIKKSDIIINNFALGVMDRLNLDYERVKKIKKDIIYCSISGFGQNGPYSSKPSYDVIAQAASGWTAQMDPPSQAPVGIGDMNASIHAVIAILAAFIHRERTGQGQSIDISLMDCLFAMHENTLPWYLITSAIGKPIQPPRVGRLLPGYAPYGIYKGKDGEVAIALLTDARWPALLEVMGPFSRPLKDPRFYTVASRCTPENCPDVHQAVEDWVMSLPSVEEAERLLDKAGIPCMRARTLVELAETDPQIKAREMMVRINQPFIGPMKMYGSPFKLSETPSFPRGYSPFLGEHNRKVLSEVLGLDQAEIDALYKEDVLYHEPCVEKLDKE
jgi:crotonobetainyl-CoA:carnitine CoA-transferase CaiB-like acyl-CoA transferase